MRPGRSLGAAVLVWGLAAPASALACRTAGPAAAARVPPDPCAAPETAEKAALAQRLVKEKKHAEAEGAAKEALAACATHEAAVAALGESLVGQKKHDEAIERMTSVLKAKADLAYAYYWRGQAHYSKKQIDRMVGDFEMFVKLAPNAPEAAAVKQLLATFK